jgi:two-component system cell cycle sensor histidine kinase/response regulator CckA
LLVTDLIMPGMTGRELAERMKPLRPGMKVLYISGYSGNVLAGRGLLDSGVAYLAKPFAESALAGKVREVLGSTGARGTILVVDDDEGVRKLLEHILTAEGYAIVTAANGREAVEIVREHSIDLLITDLVMPEVEGFETIQAVRGERPGVKIIAVSGAFGGKFLKAAVKLGASATLLKPIGRDKLLSTVRAVLG